MSTRKLIAVALLCGLVILAAGGIQLVRILGAQETSVPEIGDRITVSGVEAVVTMADIDEDRIAVAVEMSVPSDVPAVDDVAGAWTVSTGGVRNGRTGFTERAQPDVCPTEPLAAGTTLSCSLAFERGQGSPVARFTVRGVTAVWDLAGG